MRDAINSVLNRLPPGTDPPVIRKQDVDASPVLSLAIAGQRDRRELYVLADRDVKNIIESARGVGQVTIAGASDRAVQIQIEAQRLAAYGLSIIQVREALERQNAEIPGGLVDTGPRELNLRTLGRFTDPRSFADLVVATVHGTPVRLRDLGKAVDTTKEVRSLARLNGQPAVVLEIQRQSGANTVEVIDAVKERLERCREVLPRDVSLEILRDQSRYIQAALHEIQKHLIVGSILASAVVLLFMRSWRSTLIAAVAIPTSLVATFAMMRAMDFTLNNVTMLALVLMVGVVIDDAIVVLENIFHWIEERGVHSDARRDHRHAGDRPGGAGHHAVTGDRLPARLVHLQRRRPDAVRVRADRHGGDSRVDDRQLLADAHDVFATAQADAGHDGRGRLAPRLLSLDRTGLRRLPALLDAVPLAGARRLAGGDRVERAALSHGRQGLHTDECGRRGIRGQRHGTGRRHAAHDARPRSRPWRPSCGRSRALPRS